MTLSFLLALVCAAAVALAAAPAVVAQNSPQDYVNAHNTARANVGEGLPPVSWDRRVARYAQDYANKRARDCQLVHSGGPYGENIFLGSGRAYTAADAVRAWVAERRYYDYYSNTCATGQVCGHYTQVVWRSSTVIGCGRVLCYSGAIFIICNYDPPGNVDGERPYNYNNNDEYLIRINKA
ncbi:pathogenesis-related protein 1-like [Zingiber officinale]|uniref:pathogenesis-related protein 1-like n=1 Tax=Zingiber officinale TaxID=94328 RepID=UPI001C4BDA57|nr:pathogenesis-related protein 1-like [Zingiber officinale]